MRRALVSWAVVVTLALVAITGCKKKQPPARAVTPPTQQEAEAFGKDFAKNLAPCTAGELDRLIDTDLMLARAVAQRSLAADEVRGVSRGLGTMGNRLCKELGGQNIIATYLRTQTVDGTPRPLVRLVFDAGLNYYQLELDKQKDSVRAADIYIFLSGERMSETLGKVLDALVNTSSQLAISTIQEMKREMQAGNWEAADRLYKSLPDGLRSSKPVKLVELQIASELGDDRYLAAMDSYAKAYPNDPSLALVQIDRMLLKKQYDQALVVVDQLDKLVGGDPYLELLRVDAYLSLNKHADAVTAAKRGTAAEPTLEQLWWAQLSAQAASEQFYADALPTIETLRDTFQVDVSALPEDERFVQLSQSDVYKAWLAKQTQ